MPVEGERLNVLDELHRCACEEGAEHIDNQNRFLFFHDRQQRASYRPDWMWDVGEEYCAQPGPAGGA